MEADRMTYDAFVFFTLFVYAAVWFTLGWLWCDWYHKSKDDSGNDGGK